MRRFLPFRVIYEGRPCIAVVITPKPWFSFSHGLDEAFFHNIELTNPDENMFASEETVNHILGIAKAFMIQWYKKYGMFDDGEEMLRSFDGAENPANGSSSFVFLFDGNDLTHIKGMLRIALDPVLPLEQRLLGRGLEALLVRAPIVFDKNLKEPAFPELSQPQTIGGSFTMIASPWWSGKLVEFKHFALDPDDEEGLFDLLVFLAEVTKATRYSEETVPDSFVITQEIMEAVESAGVFPPGILTRALLRARIDDYCLECDGDARRAYFERRGFTVASPSNMVNPDMKRSHTLVMRAKRKSIIIEPPPKLRTAKITYIPNFARRFHLPTCAEVFRPVSSPPAFVGLMAP